MALAPRGGDRIWPLTAARAVGEQPDRAVAGEEQHDVVVTIATTLDARVTADRRAVDDRPRVSRSRNTTIA